MMKMEIEDAFGLGMDAATNAGASGSSSPMSMNEECSTVASFQMNPQQPQQLLQHQQQQPQPQQQQQMTEAEIFRSMKINDTSKTPYSDATQVYLYNVTPFLLYLGDVACPSLLNNTEWAPSNT